MESDRSAGSMYRLVVSLAERDVIYDAAPFRNRKRAISHVAAAVRHHAREGTVASVTLQGVVRAPRPRPAEPQPTNGNGHWTPLEQWDSAVVRRILQQQPVGRTLPAEQTTAPPPPIHPGDTSATACGSPHQPECTPTAPRQTASQDPPPTTQRRAASPIRKGHRWHTAIVLVLAGLVWVALAAVLAGGHLSSLFGNNGPPQPGVVSDLPFEPPAKAKRNASPPSIRSDAEETAPPHPAADGRRFPTELFRPS